MKLADRNLKNYKGRTASIEYGLYIQKGAGSMVSQKVTVINQSGLHARPAMVFCKLAQSCQSELAVLFKEKRLDPKKLFVIMSAAITCGSEITIECHGETEAADLKLLIDAVEGGLGE